METITKYKAFDGLEFTDAAECVKHEDNCAEAAHIMSLLPTRPDGCDFSNGSGFLLHDEVTFLNARRSFCEFAKRYTDHKWLQDTIDKELEVDASWAGRIIGEVAPRTISQYWHRFSCTDGDLREWGQPYYALHPHEGTQEQLN